MRHAAKLLFCQSAGMLLVKFEEEGDFSRDPFSRFSASINQDPQLTTFLQGKIARQSFGEE